MHGQGERATLGLRRAGIQAADRRHWIVDRKIHRVGIQIIAPWVANYNLNRARRGDIDSADRGRQSRAADVSRR